MWRERNLLELLLFKLEEERLVVEAGSSRWLGHASREVELVLAELRAVEASRADELAGVAHELGLQPTATLCEVGAASPPPWDGLLEQHREAFLVATREIGRLGPQNRDVLGHRATEAAIAWLEATSAVGTRISGRDPAPKGATLRLVPHGR